MAADQGNTRAQIELGLFYCRARGVENIREAVSWFRKAADQGDADAQFQVGHMYQYGRGVKQDIEKAREYYKLAAAQGNASAISALKGLAR